LHARYRPQLAAYWKAVSEIAKLDVEAAIYSTAAGALVRYKTGELAQEWSRLENCHSTSSMSKLHRRQHLLSAPLQNPSN